MAQLRDKARSCKTYVAQIGKSERTVIADVAFTAPSGVDSAYAFCQQANDIQQGLWGCEAALAHAELVAMVLSFGDSQEAALGQLRIVVPAFAEALVAS